MPLTEIDTIFAAAKEKTKKITKKSNITDGKTQPSDEASTKKKRSAPETVLDPSSIVPAVKRAKTDVNARKKFQQEDHEHSRRSGSRRRTEEGFAIYKEDELGISNEGGDTSLCPFDCQCCF